MDSHGATIVGVHKVEVLNSTFIGHTAHSPGAAVRVEKADLLDVVGCSFANNSA